MTDEEILRDVQQRVWRVTRNYRISTAATFPEDNSTIVIHPATRAAMRRAVRLYVDAYMPAGVGGSDQPDRIFGIKVETDPTLSPGTVLIRTEVAA